MRLREFCAAVLALLAPAVVVGQRAKSGTPITLQSASARGLVEYTFSGTGASSGDSIRLTVQKTPKAGDRSFAVTVPAGSVLHSSDPTFRNMVVSGVRGVDRRGSMVRPGSRIYLGGQEPITIVLSAFYTEFDKANPSPGVMFTLQQPEPILACIVRQSRNLSMQAQQAAVWIYSDSTSYEHMRQKFQVGPGDWTAAQGVVEQCHSMIR